MKLDDLLEALAGEVELAQPRLDAWLEQMAAVDAEDPAFLDALEQYSGQVQRMGEAAEMAGFPGLQAVCNHVLENSLVMPMLAFHERGAVVDFLRGWVPLIAHYLRHVGDTPAATAVVDHLMKAPSPLDESQSLKIMHMLGAMPQQMDAHGGDEPKRAVLATPADVALTMPEDVDQKLLDGFLQEAPEQARRLVELARNMAAGQGDASDLVAARRLAHTLKGSGAIIGLAGLTSLGHHFEDILDHFERSGGEVARTAADALLDAAYCLEQMVGYVAGIDEFPQQAQAVLQDVLDLANRIDRGESLEVAVSRNAAQAPVPVRTTLAPAAALRVSVDRVEELFRVSGEISVHGAAVEARIRALTDGARDLLAQNLRVQKRLFELETLVDVRAPTAVHGVSARGAHASFDPLEMAQYGELQSTTHALVEESADARVLSARLQEEIAQLAGVQARQDRLTKDLQHLVIGTRMTEAATLESRLQRSVRATCQATGKEAVLVFEGGETRIDSDILGRLAEPLLHLLRNAVDHGLEPPDVRLAAGKEPTGRVELSFSRVGQQVLLRCRDDGRGLDVDAIRRRAIARGLVEAHAQLAPEEVSRLVMLPGFSTTDSVGEVSGRGIGLEVVRDWAQAMGAQLRIDSRPGEGCSFELRFAASLSTVQSLIVEADGQRFALPSQHIEQAVARGVGSFEHLGDRLVYRLGKRVVPARRLTEVAGWTTQEDRPLDQCDAVIVTVDHAVHALAVDRLVDSRELLVKNPGRYARHVRGVIGLSILGDGAVAPQLDIAQLIASGRASHVAAVVPVTTERKVLPGVLIVDDALSVRNSLLQLVEDAGFRAEAARDGLEAIERMREFKPDIVLTDLEMPNMNGIELTAHIRGDDELRRLPVIMITSRSQEKHRELATQAGVDSYVTKPYNDGDLLQLMRDALEVAGA